jgi:hypothetical protein
MLQLDLSFNNFTEFNIVTCTSDSWRGFGELVLLNFYRFVTTSNYNIITDLHTPKIAVTTAHMKTSQSGNGF